RAARRLQSARRSGDPSASGTDGRLHRRNRAGRQRVVATSPQGGRVMNRREFIEIFAAAAILPALSPQESAREWGSPVFDVHFHLRPQASANITHLDGAGVTKANLLTRGRALDQVKALHTLAPNRFTWFNSADVTRPDAELALTEAVKSGAQGFGEMKFHVAADGPELRRMYALAADLNVPILVHFQEADHFANEGTWS